MKLACCAILLVVGCHKGNKAAETTGSGSAGSAEVAGSATSGSATAGSATAGSATAGSAAAGSAAGTASPELVAALDELDRWIAPVMKLDPHPRIVAFATSYKVLGDKAQALGAMAPPGVAADAWSEAVDNLRDQFSGIGLCTQDLKDYEKLSKEAKDAADDNYKDCTKGLPDAFAAVVKLAPGAKPAGTHANDPVMTPPAK